MRIWITPSPEASRALRSALGIGASGRFEVMKAAPEWCSRCKDEVPPTAKHCPTCHHCFECGAYVRPDADTCPDCEVFKAEAGHLPKLGFGQAGPNGEHWITIHPNGDDGPGQRVLIRPSAHNKGVGHVVGGAGGRLNYLKIQLKTPEQYAEQAKTRKANQKAAKAQAREQAKIDGSELPKKPGRNAALKTVRDQHAAAQADLENQIAKEMGWSTEPPEEALRGLDEAGKKKAIGEHRKGLRRDIKAAQKYAKDWLTSDAEARAAAFTHGIPFAGGPDRVGAEDLIGTDAIRKGLGYKPMSADLDAQQLRAEKARFIDGRMRESMGNGPPADTAILARRLAEHRAITPDEVATAPPEVLAGLARAVADRLDHLRAVADDENPETRQSLDALGEMAGQAGTMEDALDLAGGNADQLREGLQKAAELGLLDPERVDGMRQQAEDQEFERVGAPKPDELTADAIDGLTDDQVGVLAKAAAKKARGSIAAPADLREEAGEHAPPEERAKGKKGGKDPNDTRTIDLEDAIEAKRRKDAVTEEAANPEMTPESRRDFLRRAVEAGIVGAEGEAKPKEKDATPSRKVHADTPEQAYRLLLLKNKATAARRKADELESAVKDGRELPGVDYDPARGAAGPEQTSRGGFMDLRITEDDANEVQQAIAKSVSTLRAQALLGTVENVSAEVAAQGHLTQDEAYKGLQSHLAFGAADALNSHAQQILGGPSLDRQVIDTLGAEGAAQLLAWATHTHRKDDAPAIAEAVGDYHQRDQTSRSQKAMDEGKAAYEEAHAIHQHMVDAGPGADLKEWQALNGQRLKHLDHAQKTVARALGQMEATAALHAALKRKPPSQIRTSMGQMQPETAAAQAHAIGLAPEDFEVQGDGQGNTWLKVHPSGFQKLVRAPDPAGLRQQQNMDAIKGGEHDEKDWLPAGFARRTDPAPYAGPAAPLHTAPMDYALKDHGSVDEAVQSYIAQRTHDGWRPADIAADLQNVGHHAAEFKKAQGPGDDGGTFDMFAPQPAEPAAPAGDREKEYAAAIEKHMPSRDEKAGALQIAERYGPHFRELADAHPPAAGEAATLHGQSLHPEHARDAAFRALARHPAAAAAFKPAEELTYDEQAGLRSAFRRYFDGSVGAAPVAQPADRLRAWTAAHPAPEPGTTEHLRWQQQKAEAQESAEKDYEPYMPPGERLDRWKRDNPEPEKERSSEQAGFGFDLPGMGGPAATAGAAPEEVEAAQLAHGQAQDAEDEAYAKSHAAEQSVAAARQNLATLQAKHAAELGGDHPAVAQARHELQQAEAAHGEATQAHVEANRRTEEAHSRAFATEHGHTDPKWQAWKKEHDQALRGFKREFSRYNAPDWSTYALTHGSAAAAYKSVQDIVRGRYMEDFRAHYQGLSGQPLKGGVEAIEGSERHRVAFDPDHREHVKKLRAKAQAAVQAKDARSRYLTDQVKAKTERRLQESRARSERQTSALQEEPLTAEQAQERNVPGHGERFSLGEKAEAQIAQHVHEFAPMVDPTQPFKARTSIRMDGNEPGNETVKQQRAIKAWGSAKKVGLFLGPGSGKTNVAFGAFGEARKAGEARRGLYAVPSAVQGQFGTEALSYLEPGAMNWWANAGAPREERMAAYRDPNTHAVVVTHQALRDDITQMVASHLGQSEDAVTSAMTGFDAEGNPAPAWGREEMDRHVREALTKHGAEGLLDFLAVDEGHAALNRAGKRDSHLARVVDSLGRNAKHAGYMTGSPIKNDASEAYDWLAKIGHDKYHEGPGGISRAEFLRRYGNDLPANQEALRREMSRYVVTGRVDPGTTPRFHEEKLKPTEAQQTRLDEIDRAYSRARLAARRGESDTEAMRILAPGKFEGADEERADTLATRFNDPLTLANVRDSAYRHAINLHEDSAKLHRVVELANQYRDHVGEDGEPAPKPGVIFAHDLAAIPKIEAALKAAGHKTISLRGTMSGDKKQQAAEAFQRGEANVMILSDAGEAGLNLQRGKYLIHHDVPMTWKTWEQRTARINRLGQMDDPDIHTLMLDHEHEAKAWERAETKRDLGEAVMDGGGEALDETGIAPFVRSRLAGHAMADEEDDDAPTPEEPARAAAPTATAQAPAKTPVPEAAQKPTAPAQAAAPEAPAPSQPTGLPPRAALLPPLPPPGSKVSHVSPEQLAAHAEDVKRRRAAAEPPAGHMKPTRVVSGAEADAETADARAKLKAKILAAGGTAKDVESAMISTMFNSGGRKGSETLLDKQFERVQRGETRDMSGGHDPAMQMAKIVHQHQPLTREEYGDLARQVQGVKNASKGDEFQSHARKLLQAWATRPAGFSVDWDHRIQSHGRLGP